jgi:uncharacterized protein (TIGR02186 family)
MSRILIVLFTFSFAAAARAEVVHSPEAISLAGPMVADISQDTVQIHSSFNGAQLLIFGARNAGGDLVIAVRGPQRRALLRRKERIAGMWMHVERHKYPNLPVFYAVASTRPLKEIAPRYTLEQLGLGEQAVMMSSSFTSDPMFDRALASILEKKGLWQEPFAPITYFGESLFKARLNLPDTLPRGEYSVEVYLFDKGKPIAFQTIPLTAYKTGIDARITGAADQHAGWYGLFAVLMALAGGWLAHRLFYRPATNIWPSLRGSTYTNF